jgi:hypothetical protein
MASAAECHQALDRLAARLAQREPGQRKSGFDRSLNCRIPDLGVEFRGRFSDGLLTDIEPGENPAAQIRLTMASDDLVKLIDGQLKVASAWATGRMRVDASVRDVFRLKSLF